LVSEGELAMAIKVNWQVCQSAELRTFDINEAALLKSCDLLKKLSRIWLCSSMDDAIHRKIRAVQDVQLC
jgi:hypothetical protein